MARFRPVMGSRINNHAKASGRALRNDLNAQINQLLSNFSSFLEDVRESAADAMVEALEPTMDQAIVYTPEATGKLRASAFLEAVELYGQPTVVFGFGRGGQPSYAIYVHEMPYEHEPPTRSKFLQVAVEEDLTGIQSRFVKGMRSRVKA